MPENRRPGHAERAGSPLTYPTGIGAPASWALLWALPAVSGTQSWTRAIRSPRRITFTAVPASRTSKPAVVGEQHLVARLDPAGVGADGDDDPRSGSCLSAGRDDQPVARLGLVVARLDDHVVVERLERDAADAASLRASD